MDQKGRKTSFALPTEMDQKLPSRIQSTNELNPKLFSDKSKTIIPSNQDKHDKIEVSSNEYMEDN